MASKQWYCRIDGQEVGPISKEQLRALAQGGSLAPGALVRRSDEPDWTPAYRWKSLFQADKEPQVPEVVRICGLVIHYLSAVIGVLNIVVTMIAILPWVVQGGPMIGVFVLVVLILQSAMYFILFRLGQGLVNGERNAVFGLIFLALLGGCVGFGLVATGRGVGQMPGYFILAVVGLLILPPIGLALANWKAFH